MNGEPLLILLVEDNSDHAELVIRSMQDHKISNRIKHLKDGAEALDYLFNQGEFSNLAENPNPNLILLDLRLPKIDGLEVLKNIKESEQLKKIPVVILTSSDAEQDIAKAYSHHANSYLVKPMDYTKFVELMQELGFYWLAWNQNPFE